MRLTLNNFRKWKDRTFDFGDGSVVKVSGESGAGKSTIFEAVYWCLYGRLQKIATKGMKSGTTEVQMESTIDGVAHIVHRWGQKAVSLTIGDTTYEGDEAQSRINSIFGTHDLFLMTSYMRAEIVHPLLTASPSEKRELTGLIFPDASKYDLYRSRLMELKRNSENDLYAVVSDIKRLEANIQTLEDLEEFKMTIDPPVEMDLETLKGQMSSIAKEYDESKRVVTIYGSLEDQLSTCIPKPPPDMEEIDALKTRLTSSRTVKIRIDLLQDRLQEIDRLLGVTKAKTIDGVDIKVCDQLLSLSPSIASLDAAIHSVGEEHEKASYLLIQYEQSLLAQEHNARIEDVLECPNCKSHLLHLDEGLIICPERDLTPKPITHQVSQVDVQKLRTKVARLGERKNDLIDRYNRYKKITMDYGIQGDMDVQSLKETILDFQRLDHERRLLDSKIKAEMEDKREYITTEDRQSMESRIKELESLDMEFRVVSKHKASLEARIHKIVATYPWVTDSTDHLQKIENRISILKDHIAKVEVASRSKRLRERYEAFKSLMTKATDRKDVLERRIVSMAKAEAILTGAYQDYVGVKLKDIECEVSSLAKLFFDQSMNILLIPGKDSISGIQKPSFDLDVEYGGIHYDDIRLMSTGERKRLSLILMMVISSYAGGKMFLLDEALNSIGADTRGIIMNEISRMKLPTLITSHDDIPGGYAYELIL